MGKWIHRLSNIDLEEKVADCANCGRVLILAKNGRSRCRPAELEHGSTRRQKRNLEHPRNLEYPVNITDVCPICLETTQLIRDHDHFCCDSPFLQSCGKCFRGYICKTCNVGIGMLKDSQEVLHRAMTYLNTRPLETNL